MIETLAQVSIVASMIDSVTISTLTLCQVGHSLHAMIVSINTSLADLDPSVLSNEIALDEALDALDPLRHLRGDKSLGDDDDSDSQSIVPIQPRSTYNELIRLSFPNPGCECSAAIHVVLKVDASPGCGGIAWPAGEVCMSILRRFTLIANITDTGSRKLSGPSWGEVLHGEDDLGAGQWNWISWADRRETRGQCFDY